MSYKSLKIASHVFLGSMCYTLGFVSFAIAFKVPVDCLKYFVLSGALSGGAIGYVVYRDCYGYLTTQLIYGGIGMFGFVFTYYSCI